ncbi:MAG: glycosyl hydrolase, partial [Gemmatimonadota bacterium]
VAQAPGRPTAGSDDYTAPNPPDGALLTYWIREAPSSTREARRATEKSLREAGRDIPFPGYDALRREAVESGPLVFLQIADAAGKPVRRLEGSTKAGLHRINWNLRGPVPDPIDLSPPGFRPPWGGDPQGPLMAPGRYTAQLVVVSSSGVRQLGQPQSFEVKPVPNARPGTDYVAVAAFQQETAELMRQLNGAGAELGRVRDRIRHMQAALAQTPRANPALQVAMDSVSARVVALQMRLNGDPAKQGLDQSANPGIQGRVGEVMGGHWETRQMPTATQREAITIGRTGLATLTRDLVALMDGDLARLEASLAAAGAPWTPGRRLPQD